MTTKVVHKGSVREWEGFIGIWLKHSEIITSWCEGLPVESRMHNGLWKPYNNCSLELKYGWEYRLVKRKPEPLEVWIYENEPFVYLKVRKPGFYSLSKSYYMDTEYGLEKGIEYTAPDLRTYYAREIWYENFTADEVNTAVREAAQVGMNK